MPTFDGGHGYLTALLPISTRPVLEGGMRNSPVHLVREKLSALPTAVQSPFSAPDVNSPFSHNLRTHFLRMAVIDTTVFNGRVNKDTLTGGADPMVPQPVDELNCPYLLFVAEFDAPNGTRGDLDSYLRELWSDAGADLAPILRHCHGFGSGTDADGFAKFVEQRMVETTMPFNDYWVGDMPTRETNLPLLTAAALAVWFVSLVVVYGVFGLLGWHAIFGRFIVSGVIGAAVTLVLALYAVRSVGSKPFPAAPGSDLPSILKALHLQRAFGQFAVEAQQTLGAARRSAAGMATEDAQRTVDAALYEAFGRFLIEHKPQWVGAPTQTAGVVPAPLRSSPPP